MDLGDAGQRSRNPRRGGPPLPGARWQVGVGAVSSRRAEHNQHQISRVLVLGAGTMGTGIARVVAQAGLWVSLCDVSPDALGRARERIERALDRDVERD